MLTSTKLASLLPGRHGARGGWLGHYSAGVLAGASPFSKVGVIEEDQRVSEELLSDSVRKSVSCCLLSGCNKHGLSVVLGYFGDRSNLAHIHVCETSTGRIFSF